MASYLVSAGNGDFTDATIWRYASVVANSYIDSEAGTTATTTSPVASVAWTAGVSTFYDGVAVKIASRVANPTGTFTITIKNNSYSTSASVTVNVADLPNVQGSSGWAQFSIEPQFECTSSNCHIEVSSSVDGEVTLYRNATAGNWSRMLLIQPGGIYPIAASDIFHVIKEYTGIGTGNNFTVTMNNTSTTLFGLTTTPQSITIGNGGTLTYGTAAATAYHIRYRGFLDIYSGGTLNIGTSGTRIPTNSTATLEMYPTANVDTGLRVYSGGTLNAYGISKQRWTKLTSDVAASATSIPVSSSSGWIAGDSLYLTSTANNTAYTEAGNISVVNSPTQITTSVGLLYDHTGTGMFAGEITNITSNVLIKGRSATLQGYQYYDGAAQVNLDNCEMLYHGSAVANKYGVQANITTGSVNINSCAFHDFVVTGSIGFRISALGTGSITLSNNSFITTKLCGIYVDNIVGTNYNLINNLIASTTASYGIRLMDVAGTLTDNIVVSAATGYDLQEINTTIGTFNRNVAHSNTVGFYFYKQYGGIVNGITTYHNIQAGISTSDIFGRLIINDPVCKGNGTGYSNILYAASVALCNAGELFIRGGILASTPTQTTTYGLQFTGPPPDVTLESCTFGVSGLHATSAIAFDSQPLINTTITLINCVFSDSTQFNSTPSSDINSSFQYHREGGVEGANRTVWLYGTTSLDSTIYYLTSPSQRITPNNANIKFENCPLGKGFRIPVLANTAATISIKIRKSVAGDGTAYNGSNPRLIARRNGAIGINSDTVIATYSGTAGDWQTVSGSTPVPNANGVIECYVDCDGTQGWINIDNLTVA
jgi:hypothetical protein